MCATKGIVGKCQYGGYPTTPPAGITSALTLEAYEVWIDRMPVVGAPRPAREIDVRFSLSNHSGQPLDLNFISSQSYDIILRDDAGREIWRWSENKLFTRVMRSRRIADGERLAIDERVSMRIHGQDLPEGNYELEFQLVSQERFSGRAPFRVRYAH